MHPGVIGGMCIRCGEKTDEGQSGVAFGYIHKVSLLKAFVLVLLKTMSAVSLLMQAEVKKGQPKYLSLQTVGGNTKRIQIMKKLWKNMQLSDCFENKFQYLNV